MLWYGNITSNKKKKLFYLPILIDESQDWNQRGKTENHHPEKVFPHSNNPAHPRDECREVDLALCDSSFHKILKIHEDATFSLSSDEPEVDNFIP